MSKCSNILSTYGPWWRLFSGRYWIVSAGLRNVNVVCLLACELDLPMRGRCHFCWASATLPMSTCLMLSENDAVRGKAEALGAQQLQ